MVGLSAASISSEIHLIRVSKQFHTGRHTQLQALNRASLWIRRGETMSVVGPTGCGKSTLLRVIAGLEQVDSGTVTFDGEGVDDLTPSQRGIGLVFQNYALYPHFEVRGNIAFYFRLRRWSETDIDTKVREVSRIMGMGFDALLGRMPRSLSGGEKQRVALARCLSHDLRVLLLDEPFSNLDAALRHQTRSEVKKLIDRFGLTTVFVTHDQSEAVAMGHRVAVMREGCIEQVGTYHELYHEPRNTFVAGFLGSPAMNFFPGRCGQNAIDLEIGGSPVAVPIPEYARNQLVSGDRLTLGLRPEHMHLASATDPYTVPATVEMVEVSLSDATQVVYLRQHTTTFCVKLDLRQTVRQGETVRVQIPDQHLYYFDRHGQRL